MNKAKAKIQQAWDENPLAVIAIASGAAIAAAKLIDSISAASNSRSWKKEVDRRVKKS
jgi:hypothetical protein